MEYYRGQALIRLQFTMFASAFQSVNFGMLFKVISSFSGLFTSAGQSSSYSNIQNQSVSQSLRKTRPLISPATFSPDSSTPPRNGRYINMQERKLWSPYTLLYG